MEEFRKCSFSIAAIRFSSPFLMFLCHVCPFDFRPTISYSSLSDNGFCGKYVRSTVCRRAPINNNRVQEQEFQDVVWPSTFLFHEDNKIWDEKCRSPYVWVSGTGHHLCTFKRCCAWQIKRCFELWFLSLGSSLPCVLFFCFQLFSGCCKAWGPFQ